MRTPFGAILALALLLASCQGQAPTTPKPKAPRTSTAPAVFASAGGATPTPAAVASTGTTTVLAPSLAPTAPVATGGGGIISNNGGNIVSDHGGGLTGKVKAPAGLAARRLLALEEQGVGGAAVALQTADGKPVLDQNGKAVATTSKADGSYALVFSGNAHNLVVAATLPGGKGTAVAYVPKGVGDQPVAVDLDTASTYALGYILDQYVRVQAEPVAVLDKLPPAVAAETRTKTAVALGSAPVPDSFTPEKVVAAVESLRRTTPAVNQQLDYVRSLLFAGLSNQGIGLPATDVELDPVALALSPAGELYYAHQTAGRIFKKSRDGHLVAVAGSGEIYALAGQPGNDGVPALTAAIAPSSLAFDAAGNLYVLDAPKARVCRITSDGLLKTYASFKPGTVPAAMALGPDGKVWVALRRGVYRVDAEGATPLLVAGEDMQQLNVTPPGTMGGDGGPPLAARFQFLTSIAIDPAANEPVVFDAGAIRRVGAAKVETLAGSASTGHQDGQGAAARFSPMGDVAFGADGLIYVADTQENYLRTVGKDGTVLTIAGSGKLGRVSDGPATQNLGVPFAPLPQPDGTLYFVSEGLVRSLAKGTVTTIAGSNQVVTTPRKPDAVQFQLPKTMRYDATADALVITDQRHVWRWDLAANTIRVIAGGGLVGVTFRDGGSASAGALIGFSGLNLGADGALEYIVKWPEDTQLHLVTQTGDTARFLFAGTTAGPDELSMANAGSGAPMYAPAFLRLDGLGYYTVGAAGHIRRIEADGSTTPYAGYGTATADGSQAMDYKLSLPNVLERGPDGGLYVGAYGGVYRIDPATTQVTRVAGVAKPSLDGVISSGMKALEAPLLFVSGIHWDAQGRMLVADVVRSQVLRVEADGTIKLVAGRGGPNWSGKGVDEGLGAPAGMAFDKRGDLFIADIGAAQIKRVPKASLP